MGQRPDGPREAAPGHRGSRRAARPPGAWLIGNDPSAHIGYIANTFRQTARQSVAVREAVRSYRRYWQLFSGLDLGEIRGTGEAEWFVKRPDPGDKDATFQASGYGGPILGVR